MADKEKPKPTYVLVPRKLVNTGAAIAAVLFIGNLASFQYANYVDRNSNKIWCTIVELFNESYALLPPTTPLGIKIANEMAMLPKKFHCK